MSAPPGGPSTINGILFQILGALDRSFTLRISFEGDIPDAAELTIEPSEGGDLEGSTFVEQWKTRSPHRPWSFGLVASEVLPDLYRAAARRFGTKTAYRFVTDGRIGDFQTALGFFKHLEVPPPEDVRAALQSRRRFVFARGRKRETAWSFFSYIFDCVRRALPNENRQHQYRVLWELLSRFEVVQADDLASIAERIDETLMRFVTRTEEAKGKRHELAGRLLDRARRGPFAFKLQDLLEDCSIRGLTLHDHDGILAAASARIDSFCNDVGFVREWDVRPPDRIGRRHTIVAGESGQGKSFTLGAIARSLHLSSSLVVVPLIHRSGADALAEAREALWHHTLRHDGVAPLASFLRRVGSGGGTIRELVVIIDGLTSSSAINGLFVADDLKEVRVVLSLPADQVPGLNRSSHVEVVHVGDFSERQVRQLLSRRNVAWNRVPPTSGALSGARFSLNSSVT